MAASLEPSTSNLGTLGGSVLLRYKVTETTSQRDMRENDLLPIDGARALSTAFGLGLYFGVDCYSCPCSLKRPSLSIAL